MTVRLNLDHALTLASEVGVWGGLDQRQLRAQIPRMNAVHAALMGLLERAPAQVPAMEMAEAATRWAEARAAAGEEVVVLGEPSAVAAARALAATAPAPARVSYVDGLDAQAPRGAKVHLLVLDGPPWVRWMARAWASEGAGLSVAGEEPDAPWGSEVERLRGPADGAFGVLGPGALAAAAVSGASPLAIVAEAARVWARCGSKALFENPAFLWAAVLRAGREHGIERLFFLLPTSRLEPWGAWATRAWASLTSSADSRGDVRVPAGVPTQVATLGDEAILQHLLSGPRDLLGAAVMLEDVGAREPQDVARWALARSLMAEAVAQITRDGRPVVQVRLGSLDPPTVAGLSVVTLHAALAFALAADVDPLDMPAARRWRDLAAEAIQTVPIDHGSEARRG